MRPGEVGAFEMRLREETGWAPRLCRREVPRACGCRDSSCVSCLECHHNMTGVYGGRCPASGREDLPAREKKCALQSRVVLLM